MRWLRYSIGGKTSYGIVEGDRVVAVTGDPFRGHERTKTVHPLSAITYEIPVVPPTFYCAGLNYTQHIIERAEKKGETPNIPTQADMGYRAQSALIAHGQPVVIPKDATDNVHYEGELVAVVGKKAKHLSEEDALGCILGYTIGNDVSERTWQRSDRTMWRSKNTDTWKPMGPWIETNVDLNTLHTVVRVNGTETTRFRTNTMLFGIAAFISRMTRYITLHPGDVIWMGTDGHSPNLKGGDVVDVEITGIGTLTNPFVAERERRLERSLPPPAGKG